MDRCPTRADSATWLPDSLYRCPFARSRPVVDVTALGKSRRPTALYCVGSWKPRSGMHYTSVTEMWAWRLWFHAATHSQSQSHSTSCRSVGVPDSPRLQPALRI